MKRIMYVVLVLMCASITTVFAQQDRKPEILRSLVIEDFDGSSAEQWSIVGSRYADADLLRNQVVNGWPEALHGKSPQDTLRVFGIRGGFTRQGYNYIDVIPPGDSLILNGVVKELELWVWSANSDFYMDAEIQDYIGNYHTLEFGSIRHLGWQKLRIRIPSGIVQLRERVSTQPNIRINRLRIWTEPTARVSEFYVYLDELRGISDTYQVVIDGSEFTDPNYIEEVWN